MNTHVMRIKQRRKELGWSQEDLAQALQLVGLNLSRQAVANLETSHRNLALGELPYFALALQTDPNWLIDWETFRRDKHT